MCTVLLVLDISSAFDAVDHITLCIDMLNVILVYVALCCDDCRLVSMRDRSTLQLLWSGPGPQPLLRRPVFSGAPSFDQSWSPI